MSNLNWGAFVTSGIPMSLATGLSAYGLLDEGFSTGQTVVVDGGTVLV